MPFIPSKFYLVEGRNKGGRGGGEGGMGVGVCIKLSQENIVSLLSLIKTLGIILGMHNTVFLVVTLKSITLVIYLILLCT